MDDNKKFWDRVAKLYGPIQEKSNQKLYQDVVACAGNYLNEDSNVLEIGCGTGQFTFPLCEKVKSWEATDFSKKMILEAQKKTHPNLHYSVEDVTLLSFADNSFDVVLMANVLHIIPDPEAALDEIWRVLQPGGILLAPTFVYEGKFNKVRMRLTEMVGFRTFHKWTAKDMVDYITKENYSHVETKMIEGDPLPEAFLAFRAENKE